MTQQLIAVIAGIITAIVVSWAFGFLTPAEEKHPIGYADSETEVHVHSDFIVYISPERLDLSADEYQTTSMQSKHQHIHLHDNVGHVIHRHAHDITLAQFFESLGFTLTDDCFTTDETEYCTDTANHLQLFVNGVATTTIASYTNQEEDRLLLFYGAPGDPMIDELLSEIPDESCIYSGTCPERGIAPPESCGLTCEI